MTFRQFDRAVNLRFLNEFDQFELDGLIALFEECVDNNFEKGSAKEIAYKAIGKNILTAYWKALLGTSFFSNTPNMDGEYAGTLDILRKNLHKLDANLLFFCIIHELENHQLYGPEDQFTITQKLIILTINQYCNEDISYGREWNVSAENSADFTTD